MSAENEILGEVEALKAKFSDTRALYREVCVLLFFKFDITPTANKLYQYVRKGSMNVPTEELAKFWDDMRHKARVDIDHPDLPDPIKAVAAEAIAAIWRQASEAARGELARARLEYQAEAEQARAACNTAENAVVQMQAAVNELRARIASGEEEAAKLGGMLEAERREHAGTQGRVQELQAQFEQARLQQQRQQEAFSADLAKARGDIEAAQERAAASERRALMEIEQERQTRGRAERTAESLREKLGEVEGRERQQSLEHAETSTRLQMELNTKSAALQRTQETNEELQRELDVLRGQLAESQQAVARYQAEAQTLQGLVARLTPAPAPETPARGARRKATGT